MVDQGSESRTAILSQELVLHLEVVNVLASNQRTVNVWDR